MVSASHALVFGFAFAASVAADQVPETDAAKMNQSLNSIQSVSATDISIEAGGSLMYNKCHSWDNYNWDNAKFVCAWWHDTDYGSYANLFIKRYDGGFNSDCWCAQDMKMYDPWGSRWTRSSDWEMVCYNRDGRTAASVRHEFDSVSCAAIPIHYFGQPDPHH